MSKFRVIYSVEWCTEIEAKDLIECNEIVDKMTNKDFPVPQDNGVLSIEEIQEI